VEPLAIDKPKVRPLLAFPVRNGTQERIHLRDPEGYSDAAIEMEHPTYLLITLMNGTRDVPELRESFHRRTGVHLPEEQIRELIANLSRICFLDDDVFRALQRRVEESFYRSGTRPAALSGTAYPEAPPELSAFLGSYFAASTTPVAEDGTVSGIIAPHIDIRQGGLCYAEAYRRIAKSHARSAIVLGTAHAPIGGPRYAICPKGFETPLGTLPCDTEALQAIQTDTGLDWTAGQLGHRNEHSVEFQAVFLKYLFPDREIRILPVLCNSFADLLDEEAGPRQDASISRFVEAVVKYVTALPGEVLVIAGADLSHIGPKFGHPNPLAKTDLAELREYDHSLLRHVAAGNPETFFREIQRERDRTNVCGVPNIYTFLRIFEGLEGRLLRYDQYFEPPTASAVSYASLVF
jgi:AmmeMemoRadiSam system protein B